MFFFFILIEHTVQYNASEVVLCLITYINLVIYKQV